MESEEMEDFCDWLSGGNLDPNYEYNMKKKALDKDERLVKPRHLDVPSQYSEMQEYQLSDTYRNVTRAKQLLSKEYEIDNESLKNEMQRNYNINDFEYSEMLEQLANSKDVSVRQTMFDHSIKIKKK